MRKFNLNRVGKIRTVRILCDGKRNPLLAIPCFASTGVAEIRHTD